MKKPNTQLLLPMYMLLFAANAFAQDANELRQRAAKINETQLNRTYENNLPNARGSSVRDVSADIRLAREAVQKQEYELAQKQAEYARIKEDYAAVVADNKIRHEERVEAIRKQQEPFMNYLGTQLLNISIFDKADWYTDHLFVMIEGPKVRKLNYAEVKELDYLAASTAINTFDAVKTTATYPELVALLDEGKLLFHSARNRIAFLYERFPQQTKETELFELTLLPYYYGANRPFLAPAEELENYIDAPMYYPPTYFETGSGKENKEIGARFAALTNKYPNEGLAAAKNARRHLNPFVLYAQSLNTDNGTSEQITALKNENYWRAVHTKNSKTHLTEAFNWLNTQKEMFDKLKNLSPEAWLDMGSGVLTLSHLSTTFMIKGLLGGDPVPYYDLLTNKYKNLKKAVAIQDKEIEKKIAADKKLERQKNKKN